MYSLGIDDSCVKIYTKINKILICKFKEMNFFK